MAFRASSVVSIWFGPVPVRTKLYSVAAERPVSFTQVHAGCGERLQQQYYCAKHDAVVPRPAIAKQYRHPDGTETTLTEEDLGTAEFERVGNLDVFEFVPHGSVDPIYLGKAMLLGPEDKHESGYAAIVDALEDTGTAAIGLLYVQKRDQLVLIQRYGERGLLLHELFHAEEVRPVHEVKLPASDRDSLVSGASKLWTDVIEQRRKPAFEASRYEDGYPDRVLRAAERKGMGVPPLLKAGRERAIHGPVKAARKEGSEPGSVRKLPVAAVRREEPA
jgi:DNA end-binding protein Ku